MLRISAIIPSHNNASDLRRCLAALQAEGMDGLEVIVVDDASSDDTPSAPAQFGAKALALKENAGPAAARNLGARHASGDILWFLDADVEARPGTARLVRDFFEENPEAAAVIGSYDDEPSAPNACSQFKNLFHHFVHQSAGPRSSSFWCGCGAVRRTVFEEVGGFDSAHWRKPMIEDIHFGYTLTHRGHSIHVLKALRVRHNKRWTVGSLIKTDIFHRAVPWTALLLRHHGVGRNELNLAWAYRASVVCVYLAAAAAVAGFAWPAAWAAAPLFLAAVIALNHSLVRFFRRKRGWAFLPAAIPLLWLYFFYCGVGFALGVARFGRQGWEARRKRGPAT